MCQRPSSVRLLTRHHLVPQAWYRERVNGVRRQEEWLLLRRDSNTNVVPLCRPCHDLIDNGPWSDRRMWRAMLRRLLLPGEVAHVRRAMGQSWLEREYPSRDHRLALAV